MALNNSWSRWTWSSSTNHDCTFFTSGRSTIFTLDFVMAMTTLFVDFHACITEDLMGIVSFIAIFWSTWSANTGNSSFSAFNVLTKLMCLLPVALLFYFKSLASSCGVMTIASCVASSSTCLSKNCIFLTHNIISCFTHDWMTCFLSFMNFKFMMFKSITICNLSSFHKRLTVRLVDVCL